MYVLQVIFAVGGWSGGSPTNVIESYDTRADRWILVETADTGDYRNNWLYNSWTYRISLVDQDVHVYNIYETYIVLQ